MDITVIPTKLSGVITPPPSKSQAHRALIAAALADGECVVSNIAFSQDIEATMGCLEQLGAVFKRSGNTVAVRGLGANVMSPLRRLAYPRLDCGESGSTLRFLIPIALAVRAGGFFSGRGRLMERPQKPYFDLFDEKEIYHELKDGVLTVTGMLTPGDYRLSGGVSSQFVTGLLYALPLLDGDSEIVLTSPLESADYVAMTLQVLERFGVVVEYQNFRQFHIPGGQKYRPTDMAIEADWSQAGFWYAAQGVGNDIIIAGMDEQSTQGDRVILDWGRMLHNEPLSGSVTVPIFGASREPKGSPAFVPSKGCSVSLDVSQNPDLVPPLAAWGALMNGALYIKNAGRLRIKECDRFAAIIETLSALGAEVVEGICGPDSFAIIGKPSLAGGVRVSSFNDHRIAMMAAIAATRCTKPITITEAQCVAKSYPNFWEDYETLGGLIQKRE